MNTRRVPGITRNSGWQAVDAEIARARATVQHRGGSTADQREARPGSRAEERDRPALDAW